MERLLSVKIRQWSISIFKSKHAFLVSFTIVVLSLAITSPLPVSLEYKIASNDTKFGACYFTESYARWRVVSFLYKTGLLFLKSFIFLFFNLVI